MKSAARVLDVIDYLSTVEGGATMMELSKELSIPKSSMSQILTTMIKANYLNKSKGNIFKLGHKLIVAGNRARISNDIYSSSISILKDATLNMEETTFLAIRSSNEVIYLAKVDSDNSIKTTAQPGMRKPLHCTGLGKAFLAFERDDIRNELLNTIDLDSYTSKTITDRDELKSITRLYKNQGYAIDDEENELNVYCISAPIFGDDGEMVAAISCAGLKSRMLEKKDEIIDNLTVSASKISKSQGFIGGEM